MSIPATTSKDSPTTPLSISYKAFGSPTPYAEPLWYSRNVTPHYNDSHRKLRAAVRKYIDDEILPNAFEWETAGKVPESARVLWGLGGGNGIGVPPIVNFGTQAQKEKFLPGVANGKIRFCLGITEPDAGSDVAGIKTTAERKGDHYVVNGSKKWITNGIWADYVTAAVRTGGSGAAGVSLLIISLKAPGVSVRQMHNSGVGASGSTFITFEDVIVPVENLIHKENRGFEVIMSNFNAERKSIATSAIRLSRVCAEDAWNHACTRETFGHKLIENPIIRAKFVKMGRMIEPAQAFLEQLTWLIEASRKIGRKDNDGVRIGGMTALLKVMSTRCLEKCAREAQQIMGGLGYAKGGKGGRIEAISRDVRVMAVGGGSEEIMSELAIREETKDLLKYAQASSKL
ncbi:Acyl-dehydrogenase [Hyphodiscus hymeniophilus]|uniref:Acyl-dehydrogenase n=1 Tax=Hyphodiscus hymeniophilus TaxID=353542 RepID=A0A9P6VF64_9HELO|nr:Acyl-dehydrogenase [Hyphodiscus hymeniophilus]